MGDADTADALAEVAGACVSKLPEYDSACAGNVGDRLLGVTCGACACTRCLDSCCIDTVCDDYFGECAVDHDVIDHDVIDHDVIDTTSGRFDDGWCTAPDECSSGFCLDTVDGKQCGEYCVDSCEKSGFTCQGMSSGGDWLYLCLPAHLSLCRYCETDADCVTVIGGGTIFEGSRCLTLPDGKHCGLGCDDTHLCPGGFTCTPGEAGATAQCVPDSGVCTLP